MTPGRLGPLQVAVLTRLANHPDGQTTREMSCVGTPAALSGTLQKLAGKDPALAEVAATRQAGRREVNVWRITEAGRVALRTGVVGREP